MHSGNPFNEQIPKKWFVGRTSELRSFEAKLAGLRGRSPGHSYVAGIHGTGKTAFLSKLVEMAQADGFVAVRVTLPDPGNKGHDPLWVVQKVVGAIVGGVDEHLRHAQGEGAPQLVADWEKDAESAVFKLAKSSVLDSDELLADLRTLDDKARASGADGIVLCIDEAQWLSPSALSALKNALQQQEGVLVMLSLRIRSATGGASQGGRVLLDSLAEDAGEDTGASRLFGAGIGMGPFATDEEALLCINERLKESPIEFDPAISRSIVQLAERVPREIIRYARAVWDEVYGRTAPNGQPPPADQDAWWTVVKHEHHLQVQEAQLTVARLSGLKRSVLEGLVDLGGTATANDLAHRLDSGGNSEIVRRAVLGELEDLVGEVTGLADIEGTFTIVSPVDQIALRIALAGE